jgi:predicted NUDIX family NTP pyrophosphohydrolase
MYRRGKNGLEVLLVHPGGPFWAKKDIGAWSIPKGEYSDPEEPLAVAVREFEEETGLRPLGDFQPLGELLQPSRKIVTAWAMPGDFDTATLKSNTFEMEWPPKSGRKTMFPEVDRAE